MAAGLEVTIDDGLATVTLCRNGGNRLSWALLGALRDTARDLADRVDVRAVLLTAQGRDFSRGADLTDADLAERMRTDAGSAVADLGRRLIDAWAGLPQPTVVGLRGWVVGGAVGLALACDLRIAAPDTRFSLPEIDRAMHLGWGIIPRLVAEFGAHTARWLALTGESIAADRLPVGAVHVDGAAAGGALDQGHPARRHRRAPRRRARRRGPLRHHRAEPRLRRRHRRLLREARPPLRRTLT